VAKVKKQSPPQTTASHPSDSKNPFAALEGDEAEEFREERTRLGVETAAAAEKRMRNVAKKLRDARALEGGENLSPDQQAKVARIPALAAEIAALEAVLEKFAVLSAV
jgi:hypothetical protein